ncbi:MAG: zf-HC2 domain-containing protein [Azonexus sp.]|nr:zf-HC2 domain-containing protein [Betaproteobacteria bacterium]MBK8918071.1 zf-HC2 domain-containing protein [Betaproteobacteria bacterium]MBP6035292.1 zf-HC2 domain-containing protein [Azonexus sp.]MBP6906133.1 zf-HC2 domain-containing protein [Azonexus sp.]
MLSCKEATRLASQGMERPLTLAESIRLRMHQIICGGCRRAEKQFQFLRDAAKAWRAGPE